MSAITTDDPTTSRALRRLRRALTRLEPTFRRDLHTVAANPARVGAAGLTAGVYAVDATGKQRWVCPTTAVLLLRGETTWPALPVCEATCFDALHQTETWNDWSDSGAVIEDFHGTLDDLAEVTGWARPGHGPDPARRGAVAVELQGLLLRLLGELDGGWS